MKPLTLLALVAVFPACVQARPLNDLCDQFEPLRKLADLKYIKPSIRVEPKAPNVKPQDVVFTISAKSGVMKISPAADGLVELPLTDKLCAENPEIDVNQPKGTVSLGISIDPRVPPVSTLDYRLLESLRGEWDTAISRQNLAWRLLAPRAKAYQINFEPGKVASAEVRLPTGARRLTADAKGVLRIPFDESWVSANPAIVLSETPKRIGLAFD